MARKKDQVYSPQNVISLVVVFFILFWLLYSIGSFLHESSKINDEITQIYDTNVALEEEIESKKQYIEYLQTPQRIEKEAKLQMGKRLPNEKVLVFVEESLDILPTEAKRAAREQLSTPEVPHWKKWQWYFFGERS